MELERQIVKFILKRKYFLLSFSLKKKESFIGALDSISRLMSLQTPGLIQDI